MTAVVGGCETPAAPDPWADALLAARLLAADPGLGGAVVRAPAGPARDAWLAAFRAAAVGPVVRLPLGIDDARLLGGVDLAATLAAGRPVAARGLLAEAAGGTLIVAMAERIDAGLAGKLAAALDGGGVRLILLDEGEGDEAVPAALAERCGVWVTLPVALSPAQFDLSSPSPPGAAGERGGSGWGSPPQRGDIVPPPQPSPLSASRGGREQSAPSEADLPHVPPRSPAAPGQEGAEGSDPVATLCATAFAFGVDSARAALFAVRAARGMAALRGAATDEDDLATAARLILLPRATRLPAGTDDADAQDCHPREGGDPSPDSPQEMGPRLRGDDSDRGGEDSDAGDLDAASPDAALTDRIVAAATAALPPGLFAALAAGRAPAGRGGGSGALRKSAARGRPLPSRAGALRGGQRLALVDTLRAAAPWQKLRRAPGENRVVVRRDDFRIRRFAERAEATTIFAVDASGSAAVARLAEAKGAVELLLAEAYVARTQVALVAFRGVTAEVVLPPTRSLARAKRALAGLAGGGGTPLATGLEAAAALARVERSRGRTPFVVVLTDGRANIARDATASRERAAADALAAARVLAGDRIAAAFVDTSVRPRPEGAALAAAMGARYAPLPAAGAAAMAGVVRALAPAGVVPKGRAA